jgi:hypothetical protein
MSRKRSLYSAAELRQAATELATRLVSSVTPEAVLQQMAGREDLDSLTREDWNKLFSILLSYRPAPISSPMNANTLRRRAFALAGKMYRRERAEEVIRDMAGGNLSAVSRQDWERIIRDLLARQTQNEAPGCEPGQWRLIQHKRRQLGMTDEHLENLIKSVLKIDVVEWMDARGARRIITVLNKQLATRKPTTLPKAP